ncbi:MAG: hypothetical protein QXO69_03035 [archaeon]
MNKELAILLMLAASAFAAVTLEQAQATVTPYFLSGEQLDIRPATLTTSGSSSYWVLEAKSLNQIQVMFPVDANTGNIETSSSVKDVLKTHYLANFFATDDTITDYLDSQLAYAQQRGDAFGSAKDDFEFYEQQLGNITITSISSLKTALSTGKSQAEALRQKILSAKTAIASISSPNDVSSSQTALSSFFSSEAAFLSQCESIAEKANALNVELAGNEELKTTNPSLLQALQGVINTYSLRQSVTAQKDNLAQNRAAVDSFFVALDGKAEDYHAKLVNRMSQSGNIEAVNEIIKKITSYSNNYTQISSDAASKGIPDDYSGFGEKMAQLYSLINESNSYCSSGVLSECEKAKENYNEMDSLVASLKSIVSSYSTTCVNGATRSCAGGTQTCVNGAWSACKQLSGGINWTLVGAMLAAIIALLVFKFKDNIFPEKPAPSTQGALTDWQSQQYKF